MVAGYEEKNILNAIFYGYGFFDFICSIKI